MIPSSQVRKVHFDTQDYGPQAITGLEPKHVPLLHQQQSKGSLEWENNQYVSGGTPETPVGWAEGPDPPPSPSSALTQPRSPLEVRSGHQKNWAKQRICYSQDSIQVVLTRISGFTLSSLLSLTPSRHPELGHWIVK